MSVFIPLIFTCKPFSPGDTVGAGGGNSPYGQSVTVYLDGQAPASRSLNKPLALYGHDFFEVVFLYDDGSGSSPYIARAEWELGQSAGISGVYRTDAGIDYSYFTANPNPSSVPLPNYGSAVLFAGKKSDKTLLAVGVIAEIDGVDIGTLGGAWITTETKSVSFELNALKAGTNSDAAYSSFLTASGTPPYDDVTPLNTEITNISISTRTFPLYRLPLDEIIAAEYWLDVHSPSTGYEFEDYRQGIILANQTITTYMKTEAKFTTPIKTETSKTFSLDTVTKVYMNNNTVADVGKPFQNPVEFAFNTLGTKDGSIFALAFQIPVCALAPGGVRWVIRPGYDQYLSELDDGNGGHGGAVLIGSGDIDKYISYKLFIDKPPNKVKYNSVLGYSFDITGLLLNLVTNEDVFVRAITNAATTNANYDPNLKFYYPDPITNLNVQIYPLGSGSPDAFPPMNKYMPITVEYFDSITGGTYFGSFMINMSTLSTDFGEIPPENRKFISGDWEWWGIFGGNMSPGGVFLVIFNESVDFISVNANPTQDLTIVFMAGRPGLTLGRNGNITFYGGQNVQLHFGEWPFNEPIFVNGQVLETYPYNLNLGGSYSDFPNPSTLPPTDYFISNITTANILEPFFGVEVDYINEAWFKP